MQHYPYPSIEQFKNVIKKVTDKARYIGKDENGDPVFNPHIIPPSLKFVGSTKIHGTNFAMCCKKSTNTIWFQSKERIITPDFDNAGAARYFSQFDLRSIFNLVSADEVIIYGEWAGKGIQKNVGISQVDKRLIVFDVYLPETDAWLEIAETRKFADHEKGIYNVYDYPMWDIEVDFSVPQLSQNKLVEITTSVADCCPVANSFGVSGIGEGVVWRCVSTGYEDPKFRFKVKDDRHSASPIKKTDKVDMEKLGTSLSIAEQLTPSWRLEQMFDLACDTINGGKPELSKIPVFIKHLANDIIKEETLILQEHNLTYKDISYHVVTIARKYFISREKEV